jgi:hypothetical protein
MRISQKLFFSSLSSRIKCVQESLSTFNKKLFFSSFNLNSEEKLLLVLSLKKIFFLEELQSFVNVKNKSFSFHFNFPLIYNLSSELFINTSFLCALDFHSDKRSFGYKPFRDSTDIFFEIKSMFSEKFNFFIFSMLKDVYLKKSFNKSWILKNLSFERKILCSWFAVETHNFKLSKNFSNRSVYNDLYLTLINFLLYGLLWILI